MAKTHTATLQLRFRKAHTCVGCGAVYSYEATRKVTGTGGTADKARQNLDTAIAKTLKRDTDLHPCPTCGLYQPDMIGQRRAKRNTQVFAAAIIVFLVLLVLRATHALQYPTLTWIIAGVCALVALIYWAIDLRNLNADPSANRQVAEERVSAGAIQHAPGQAVTRVDDLGRPVRSSLHMAALLMLVASVAFAAAPELFRMVRHWPLNPACYPPVVGPGDTTRIYMPASISSVKGYWHARPHVLLHDDPAHPLKGTPLGAATNEKTWSGTIYAKSSEKNTTSHPWVDVTFPDQPALAGKELPCDVDLDVEYPEASASGSTFQEVQFKMKHALTPHLAEAGAGRKYDSIWWQGTVAAMGVVLGAGLVLYAQSRRMEREAAPTQVYPVPPAA